MWLLQSWSSNEYVWVGVQNTCTHDYDLTEIDGINLNSQCFGASYLHGKTLRIFVSTVE